MDDLRWFAPNRYCTLPVPRLLEAGLRVATAGDAPARLAVAADGECAVAAFEYARRHRVPLLLYIWDIPPWRMARGRPDWIFFLGGRVRRVSRLLGRYPERPGFCSRLGYITRRAEAVWCPSTMSAEAVAHHFGVSAAVVPFCFDSDRFTPAPGPAAAVPASLAPWPVLLSVSRLVPHKNHRVLLRAAARLDPKPLVRLVGTGPEAPALRALAEQLGVRLELPSGWVEDAEVVAAYRRAAVVVAPSRFEGFGLSPMEALACGIPVAASDISPHREHLGGRVHYFDPEDDAALASVLGELLGHPPDPRTIAPPHHLTIEACAARFLERLEPLLGSRR